MDPIYDNDDSGIYATNKKDRKKLAREYGVAEDVAEVRREKSRKQKQQRKQQCLGKKVGVDGERDVDMLTAESELPNDTILEKNFTEINLDNIIAVVDRKRKAAPTHFAIDNADDSGGEEMLQDTERRQCHSAIDNLSKYRAKSTGGKIPSLAIASPEIACRCVCGERRDGQVVIQCDGPCKDFFHLSCVEIRDLDHAFELGGYNCVHPTRNSAALAHSLTPS